MINKKHPDYAEYMSKCQTIQAQLMEETKNIPIPPCSQFDGAPVESTAAERKFKESLKRIQSEYSHLFEDSKKAKSGLSLYGISSVDEMVSESLSQEVLRGKGDLATQVLEILMEG